MTINERNTGVIDAFARRFASGVLVVPPQADAPAGPSGGSSARHGVEPIVQQRVNARDEADAAALWLLDQQRAGRAWRDMVVLAPGKRNWRDPIAQALEREGIPYRMLLGDPTMQPDAGDHVQVMTLHAVRELEFPVIAVLGIGDLPWKSQTLEEVARLLYVVMTRATAALLISHSKPSTLVERLLAA